MRAAFALLACLPTLLAAQTSARTMQLLARADSLLLNGQVTRAEALYYSLSRQSTRDPIPRAALGRYLASRGAFRVGATLLEEAIAFGGEASVLEAQRIPWLHAAGEWGAIAALRFAPLRDAELARARWLAAHTPAFRGADSVTVAFAATTSTGSLGRFELVIGNDTLVADLDPESDEVVLGDHRHYAQSLEVFEGGASASTVVVREASIGGLVLAHLPARLDARLGPERARVGMTVLAAFAPTVDAGAGVLTLRRSGEVQTRGGERIPVMFTFPGVRVARADRWVPLESPAGRAVLATARWTLDLRRGELILETGAR
jgi:hypothetical protein